MSRFLCIHCQLPDLGQNPNSRGHWSEKRHKKGYRYEVEIDAKSAVNAARWDVAEMVRVSLTFGTCITRTHHGRPADGRYRPIDPDNAVAAFKQGFDGLVDAGVMVDDSYRHMELGRVVIDQKQGPWVRVDVERLA